MLTFWAVGTAFVPMTVIVLFSHFNDKTDTGVSLLALVQSCSYNMVATVLLKKIAGRPRPCFYAMCEWVAPPISFFRKSSAMSGLD